MIPYTNTINKNISLQNYFFNQEINNIQLGDELVNTRRDLRNLYLVRKISIRKHIISIVLIIKLVDNKERTIRIRDAI